MDLAMEERFLRLAVEQPDILCSQVPVEILEAAASEAEPTKFLEEFFATGYTEWLSKKHGRKLHPPQEYIDRAILVLWFRTCLLETDRLLGRRDGDEDKPFFSDEGLY